MARSGKAYKDRSARARAARRSATTPKFEVTAPAPERDWPKFLGMAKSIVKLEERRHAELSEQRFGGEWRKQNKNADGLVRKGRKFGDQAGVAK